MLTLGTQRDLTNDMLIKGIIDSVVTVNQFYQMLPFKGIEGNALAYNRESSTDQKDLVSVMSTEGGTIKTNAQTFTRHSTELTTIIGDAEINGLIQAVGSDYNDATAVQIAAKAKGIGRTYMDMMVNGTKSDKYADNAQVLATEVVALLVSVGAELNGAAVTSSDTGGDFTAATDTVAFSSNGKVYSAVQIADSGTTTLVLTTAGATLLSDAARKASGLNGFDGITNLVTSAMTEAPLVLSATGAYEERLDYLDQIIDRIHDKDGMVDYLMMNSKGVRKITQAFRKAGTGFDMMDVKTSSGGVMAVQSYRGIPIFRNDFIGDSDKKVFGGTVDDGSFSHGICGLTAKRSAGMQVEKLGPKETSDSSITRVKWYCGLAHFSELGLVQGTLD